MPRAKRILFSGAYYHVYNRGVNKEPIVHDDHDRLVFMQLLGESVRQYNMELFAYCLMHNHYHLFLQTQDPNLDKAMWYLQSNHAHHMNLKYQRIGAFFQDRYKSKLVDQNSYSATLTRYIHQNPSEFGLEIDKYPWSSLPSYLNLQPRWPWLNTKWVLSQFDPNADNTLTAFKKFHRIKIDYKEISHFESARANLHSMTTLTRSGLAL